MMQMVLTVPVPVCAGGLFSSEPSAKLKCQSQILTLPAMCTQLAFRGLGVCGVQYARHDSGVRS